MQKVASSLVTGPDHLPMVLRLLSILLQQASGWKPFATLWQTFVGIMATIWKFSRRLSNPPRLDTYSTLRLALATVRLKRSILLATIPIVRPCDILSPIHLNHQIQFVSIMTFLHRYIKSTVFLSIQILNWTNCHTNAILSIPNCILKLFRPMYGTLHRYTVCDSGRNVNTPMHASQIVEPRLCQNRFVATGGGPSVDVAIPPRPSAGWLSRPDTVDY